MDLFDPRYLSSAKVIFSTPGSYKPFNLNYQNKRVVVAGFIGLDPSAKDFVAKKGCQLIYTPLENAFEIIRWEQPAFALIYGGTHGEKALPLLSRLRADPLTQQVGLVILALEPLSHLRQIKTPPNVLIQDLAELPAALAKAQKGWKKGCPWLAGFEWNLASKKGAAKSLPGNTLTPSLRAFVNEVVNSWPTFELVMLLAQHPELAVNITFLSSSAGFSPFEAAGAIKHLARSGYLEPLEFDTPDPTYSLVANPERIFIFYELARALKLPDFRLALTTRVLVGERSA